jgi:hypothetical protein
MIDTNEALDNIATLLQSMDPLVSYMSGVDTFVVVKYRDQPAVETGFVKAMDDAKFPAIIVAYMGTESALLTDMMSWRHAFSIIVKAPQVTDPSQVSENPYSKIFNLIMNGVPSVDGAGNFNDQPFKRCVIHPDCYEINPVRNADVRFRRMNGTEDFFELSFFLYEIGDAD